MEGVHERGDALQLARHAHLGVQRLVVQPLLRIGGDLAYAQSGCSTLNIHGRGAIRDLPGWPRGLCRVDHLLLVGTSENPQGGINSTLSRYIRCTITLCNYTTMSLINAVDLSYWGKGIYDLLPLDTPHTGD